MHIMEITVQKS